jgi:hypothetical protein
MFTHAEIVQAYRSQIGSVCELPKDRERTYSEFQILRRAVYVNHGEGWQLELKLEIDDETWHRQRGW